jgi:hypothetical protein
MLLISDEGLVLMNTRPMTDLRENENLAAVNVSAR